MTSEAVPGCVRVVTRSTVLWDALLSTMHGSLVCPFARGGWVRADRAEAGPFQTGAAETAGVFGRAALPQQPWDP